MDTFLYIAILVYAISIVLASIMTRNVPPEKKLEIDKLIRAAGVFLMISLILKVLAEYIPKYFP